MIRRYVVLLPCVAGMLAIVAGAAASSSPERFSGFGGVSCVRPSSCTAVVSSSRASPSGQQGTNTIAAEHWNGRRWTLQRMPIPGDANLNAISCTAADACTAVGGYLAAGAARRTALAERWNGGRWAIQKTPSPALEDIFLGVSCSSARACIAVGHAVSRHGGADTPLAERWNGHTWSIVRVPSPRASSLVDLTAISCTAPDACTAVGTYAPVASDSLVALAERWDGKHWTIEKTRTPAPTTGFNGVSCTAANACMAVGYAEQVRIPQPLAERWNGKRWTIEPAPAPRNVPFALLRSVTCSARDACTAVGSDQGTLAERWNGERWTIQRTPTTAGGTGELTGTACASRGRCTAVGDVQSGTGERTLAEAWDGRRWRVQPTLNPS